MRIQKFVHHIEIEKIDLCHSVTVTIIQPSAFHGQKYS